MRKITILFASAAIVAAVCSCVREEEFQDNSPVDNKTVSFVVKGIETRSEESGTIASYSYKLGEGEDGTVYSLLETVTDLDAVGFAPETKGTPAYTENVSSVYGAFSGVIYGASSQVAGDGAFDSNGSTWRRSLGFDPWASNDKLSFFLRMPSSPSGVSNLEYDLDGKSIDFDFTTPSSASAQQDILFAFRTVTKTEYESELASAGGAGVLFRHALTGVKFAIGNNQTQAGNRTPSGDVETFIKQVKITGLKDKGHATFVPRGTETTSDDITEFSSQGSFTWVDVDGTSTTAVYTQAYGDDDIVDYAANDAVGGPASFYAAGADRNLNKADGSLTFWFIPQEISSSLSIEVTFYVWDGANKGEDITMTLDLGARILAQEGTDINAEWKAGQLRTFTLKPTTVDVDIEDEVSGDVKSNLVIKNTGNKDAFIRVIMVGNWVDSDGNIVKPWNETQGTFTNFPNTDWEKGVDGYYYYKNAVAPGESPEYPLFDTYTKPANPEGTAGLVLGLSVQAIDSNAGSTYAAAWATIPSGEEEESGD